MSGAVLVLGLAGVILLGVLLLNELCRQNPGANESRGDVAETTSGVTSYATSRRDLVRRPVTISELVDADLRRKWEAEAKWDVTLDEIRGLPETQIEEWLV